MGAVHVDDVEPHLASPTGRSHELVSHTSDVGEGHLLGRAAVPRGRRALRGNEPGSARLAVQRPVTAVIELDTRQRPMRVDGIGHQPEPAYVVGVVGVGGHREGLVGVWRHRCVVGADSAPASLGLDPAEGGVRAGLARAEAGGVRHLVEAVGQGLGADLYRLEQNRVPGIHAHVSPPRCSDRAGSAACLTIQSVRFLARSTPACARNATERPAVAGRSARAHGRRIAPPQGTLVVPGTEVVHGRTFFHERSDSAVRPDRGPRVPSRGCRSVGVGGVRRLRLSRQA